MDTASRRRRHGRIGTTVAEVSGEALARKGLGRPRERCRFVRRAARERRETQGCQKKLWPDDLHAGLFV